MIGRKAEPYTHAPADWGENGLPYGAFCLCADCGYVGTSTMTFDYRAEGAGQKLVCDQCKGFSTHETERLMRDSAVEAFEEDLVEAGKRD
jgi:hypothetical protein